MYMATILPVLNCLDCLSLISSFNSYSFPGFSCTVPPIAPSGSKSSPIAPSEINRPPAFSPMLPMAPSASNCFPTALSLWKVGVPNPVVFSQTGSYKFECRRGTVLGASSEQELTARWLAPFDISAILMALFTPCSIDFLVESLSILSGRSPGIV
jgi:hypothetical protein